MLEQKITLNNQTPKDIKRIKKIHLFKNSKFLYESATTDNTVDVGLLTKFIFYM